MRITTNSTVFYFNAEAWCTRKATRSANRGIRMVRRCEKAL